MALTFFRWVCNFVCDIYRPTSALKPNDDVIKWKHFRVTGPLSGESIGHRWIPPHKGQWRGALMFSLICAWANGWTSCGYAGDVSRHDAQYDVTVILRIKGPRDVSSVMKSTGCVSMVCVCLDSWISLFFASCKSLIILTRNMKQRQFLLSNKPQNKTKTITKTKQQLWHISFLCPWRNLSTFMGQISGT